MASEVNEGLKRWPASVVSSMPPGGAPGVGAAVVGVHGGRLLREPRPHDRAVPPRPCWLVPGSPLLDNRRQKLGSCR